MDQIVRTSISEPPSIEVYEIPTEDDPSVGYLAVHVPASPRAPHMVTVGKEHRYYGRGATGNAPLAEGEVARLYERRQRWEVDRDAMLEQAIDSAPIPPHEDFAYPHLVARPVVPDEGLFDRASGDQPATQFLGGLLSAASSGEAFPTRYSPDLYGGYYRERRPDGWAASQGLGTEWEERGDPSRVLDLELGLDGSGRTFCGRAAQRYEDGLLVFEPLVAGLTAKFLAVMGGLYAAGGYLGPVDVGVAVTGLRGGASYFLRNSPWVDRTPYNKDQYRRTERLLASQLVGDLEVHQGRPVAGPAAEDEVVDAQHPHLPRPGRGGALGPREQGVAPDEKPQLGSEPGPGPAAQLQDDREQGLLQAVGLAGAGGHVRQPLAKDAPPARGHVAEEAPRSDLELDRGPVPGQVRDCARVAAVHPRGAATA